MPISTVGASSFQPVTLPTAATKPADTDASAASAAKTAQPDTDAAGSRQKESSAAPVNMMKINPDGTVGPMHLHRHANSPGVVHA